MPFAKHNDNPAWQEFFQTHPAVTKRIENIKTHQTENPQPWPEAVPLDVRIERLRPTIMINLSGV
ncbi:hypothetical protein OLMES_5216 [Oleiphilus messinensis]|uniref:Uncharacterized protein n=1 Tax=Oleiphilus messinensis TaxID=141451 RepID=A0A1Y0IG24_9GAMM|nr:hypothetical protein OLMES_5216 [Oleiphilus messinensis]